MISFFLVLGISYVCFSMVVFLADTYFAHERNTKEF